MILSVDEADQVFLTAFAGRVDAFGTEEGGCWRIAGEQTDIPLLHWHLNSTEQHWSPLGVYPINEHGQTRWGCIDLDLHTPTKPAGDYPTPDQAHQAALTLTHVLAHYSIPSYVERTRSDGRHVWVFAASWLDPAIMRRALRVACKIAGVPDREVNPKQESLKPGQLGNYVRLCYPGRGSDQNSRRIFVMEEIPLGYREAMTALEYAPIQNLTRLATHWQDPPPPAPLYVATEDIQNRKAQAILTWAAGAVPDDRSSGLWWAASRLRDDGLDPGLAVAVLSACAEMWGKYPGRETQECTRIVGKVYG
jgi:hypothetical protein